jgi:cytoskeletal protein CcmA (bactofilin family)
MAIFGNSTKKKQQETPVVHHSTSHSTTLIVQCVEIRGDIIGCGNIHIDGIVHGNIEADEGVVIGKQGKVFGRIKTKKAIIGGELRGTLFCQRLEVTQTGMVSDKVEAVEVIADGRIDAEVIAKESVKITKNGKINTSKLESRTIVVSGYLDGNIVASELLEIGQSGHVKGEMTAKKIKVTEGGLMLGTMLTYQKDLVVKKEETKKEIPQKETKGVS